MEHYKEHDTENNTQSVVQTNRYYITSETHNENSTLLGFWLYLMSDCLLFASLFATYAVLGHNYGDSESGAKLFNLPLVGLNTALLLISSVTFGFSMLAMQKRKLSTTIGWLAVTGLLGMCFIGLEMYEFVHLINEGASPQKSGFLTSFFTLVGTHGLHVFFGTVWLVTLISQLANKGLIEENCRRLMCLSMFWHFLDVVWIGVFTVVYLIGSMT